MMSNFLKKRYDFNFSVSESIFSEGEKRVNTFVEAQAWANIIWHGHRYECSAVRRSIPNFPGLEFYGNYSGWQCAGILREEI